MSRRASRQLAHAVIAFLVASIVTSTVHAEDLFIDSGQRLGSGVTWQVALGDVDLDGDLDAVAANEDIGGVVWLNDGAGQFTDSGQRLSRGEVVCIADLDNDGALDVLVGRRSGPLAVWWNDGGGTFIEGESAIAPSGCYSLAVGELTGDAYLDIFLGNPSADQLLINNGDRTFTDSGGRYGIGPTGGVAIGDMDGDGVLDVVAAGWGDEGHVWVNDGHGAFSSRCELDTVSLHVHAVQLADYEGDGDLDVFFATAGAICCQNLWLNDGSGVLAVRDDNLGAGTTQGIAVFDFDENGTLDIVLAVGTTAPRPSTIWLGTAQGFECSGIDLGRAFSGGISVGDLDGDGDQDLFIGFLEYRSYPTPMIPWPNEVWMNTTESGGP